MKDLLGGKGAGLAEMTIAGLPTPPGFTITTEACNDYFAAGEQLPDGPVGRRPRGDARGRAPVRQGLRRPEEPAPRERPLRREVLDARDDGHRPEPRAERGDASGPRRADRQRAVRLGRLPPASSQMFGRIVMDVDRRALRRAARGPQGGPRPRRQGHGPGRRRPARRSSTEFKAIVRDGHGPRLPDRPATSSSISRSRPSSRRGSAKRAKDYRDSQKIAHDLGTAVNVVTMVFGNMGDDSGTGVAFTRDPNTGERVLYGEYLTNAQGEDVVAGIRTAPKISQMATRHAGGLRRVPCGSASSSRSTTATSRTSSSRSSAAGCTCSRPGRQADGGGRREDRGRHGRRGDRSRRRRPSAGSSRPTSTSSCATVRSSRPSRAPRRSSTGLNASPGAAVGRAVFDADDAVEWVDRGEKVILVRIETSPDDFHGHGRQPRGSSPPAAARPRTPRSSRARSASRASPARPTCSSTTPGSSAHATSPGSSSRRATGSASTARPARSTSARCRRSRPGSRSSPSSRRSSAGPTRSAGWASGRTPTSPRRPPRPAATARRGSACAGPSTCSARASGSRSSAARSSSRSRRPAPRHKRDGGDELTADELGDVVTRFDARDGQARGPPAGRLRGHLRGDGRPAGRRSG